MTSSSFIAAPEWLELERHRDALKAETLASIVTADPNRLESMQLQVEGLNLNYALNRVTPDTIRLLTQLAAARDVEGWRARMWRGEKINATENRAALHIALRQQDNRPLLVDGRDIVADVRAARRRIMDFVAGIRDGRLRGFTGKPIRHVVNIGIGGSDLGPRLVAEALSQNVSTLTPHFVANVDAVELVTLFKQLDPAETLFIIVSKTFTTQETLVNAQTARAWLVEALGEKAVPNHFVAVSTNVDAVAAFGIPPQHTFPTWDWVGGRFSLWSAVGLTAELVIGSENFTQLLRGAATMDQHFHDAPLDKNMPVMLAMLGIWTRNFLKYAAHAVLPYSERLHSLPRYLQQLEMESNGKSVGRDGLAVPVSTAPILFGEGGTVGQHGFHQWLHQGSDIVSVDFMAVAHDDFNRPPHHQALLSNLVAQATAFAFGQPQAATPQEVYKGGRSSSVLTLRRLDPYHLGLLLALYEHKVFVQSVIWGINPFDQPGVELGKRVARSIVNGVPGEGHGLSFAAKLYAKISR